MLSESSLTYDLLLKKSESEDQCRPETDGASTAEPDEASTAEPDSPSSSSVIESVTSAMRPAVGNTIVLRNVSHACPQTDKRMEHLIKETRKLSELVFDEDSLLKATKKSNWKLSMLVTQDYQTVCCFALTKVTNGALSIAKIATPLHFRGLGFGKVIMEDAIKNAKQDRNVFEVCLSSLSTAVTFYQKLGFKALTGVKVKTDFEVEAGQVYMVKKLRPRPKGKSGL